MKCWRRENSRASDRIDAETVRLQPRRCEQHNAEDATKPRSGQTLGGGGGINRDIGATPVNSSANAKTHDSSLKLTRQNAMSRIIRKKFRNRAVHVFCPGRHPPARHRQGKAHARARSSASATASCSRPANEPRSRSRRGTASSSPPTPATKSRSMAKSTSSCPKTTSSPSSTNSASI